MRKKAKTEDGSKLGRRGGTGGRGGNHSWRFFLFFYNKKTAKPPVFFKPRKTRQKGKDTQKGKGFQKGRKVSWAFGQPNSKQGLNTHEWNAVQVVFWYVVLGWWFFLVQMWKKYAIHRFKIQLLEVCTEGKPRKKRLSFHDPQRCFFVVFWRKKIFKKRVSLNQKTRCQLWRKPPTMKDSQRALGVRGI